MLTRHAHSPATIARNPQLARYPRIRAVVSVYNTHRGLLERAQELFGGSIYAHTRQPQENHKRTAYSWRLTAAQMRVLLPQLLPWLIVKREQATLLMEALALKSELTPTKGAEWRRSEAAYPRLVEIQALVSALNRKGRQMTNLVSPLP